MSNSALDRALAKYEDNQTRFAEAIGASQQLVSYWVRKKRPLPGEYVLAAEEATGISRHELRPDIFGPAPARQSAAA